MKAAQLSIFPDQQEAYAEAREAKRRGIQQAEDNATDEWKDTAYEAICRCATMLPTITADDVWELMEREGEEGIRAHRHPAALGPVFLTCARDGEIRKTGRLVPTRLKRRHRDLVEWEKVR